MEQGKEPGNVKKSSGTYRKYACESLWPEFE